MVVKFSSYNNASISNANDQKYYEKQLSNIGNLKNRMSQINLYFNNPTHGLSPAFIDVHDFMKEVQKAAKSSIHTLEIHGSEHMDPSYRFSYLVSTYDQYGAAPAQVRDTYITISFHFDRDIHTSKSRDKISVYPGIKYHLLVGYPQVNPEANLGHVYSIW